MKRRCYYEILDVDSRATGDDIKQAYRKQAIKWHPDKNPSPEAKERFQEIGEAYAVLSDPNERTWYDHHKEQILRPNTSGLDENDEKYEEMLTFGLDIWPYFERHCFKEFDDADDGFFAVYRKVFEIIKGEEEKAKNNNVDPDDDDVYEGIGGKALPGFGDTKTSDEKVVDFYTTWDNFSTFKNFSWKDLHNPNEAGNRQIKRLIEKDNKKERQKEKKKYIDTIKNLVHYAQKRDPRYQTYIKNQMLEKQRKAEEQRKKEEAKKKEQEELKKKHREEEAERYRIEYEQRKAQGLIEEEEPVEQVHYEDWYCEICDKEFKTQNQLENHKQSKAHAKKYKELLQEMMLDEERKDFEENEESAPVDKDEEPAKKPKKKKKNKKKNQKAQEESDEEEEAPKEKVEPPKKDKKEEKDSKATQSKFASLIDQTSDKSSEKDKENSDDDMDFGQFVTMNKKNAQKNNKNTKKETAPEKDNAEVEQTKATQDTTEEAKLPENDEEKDADKQSEDGEPDDQEDDKDKAGTKEPEKKLNKAKLRKLKKQEKAKQQQAFVCNVCKTNFETRNKLYQHVKDLNHEFKMA